MILPVPAARINIDDFSSTVCMPIAVFSNV